MSNGTVIVSIDCKCGVATITAAPKEPTIILAMGQKSNWICTSGSNYKAEVNGMGCIVVKKSADRAKSSRRNRSKRYRRMKESFCQKILREGTSEMTFEG